MVCRRSIRRGWIRGLIALAVEFVTGVCRAEMRHERGRAEWPPHPDRLFMALVATMHETGFAPSKLLAFEQSIQWLEQQPPPEIAADLRVASRDSPVHYVPTNDDRIALRGSAKAASRSTVETQARVLPALRGCKPRRFAAISPGDPRVHYIWHASPPQAVRSSLAELCREVPRLGPATSLVRCWLESHPPPATLRPREDLVFHRLRVPHPGRLRLLETSYACNGDELSPAAPSIGYGPVAPPIPTPRCRLAGHVLPLLFSGGSRVGLHATLAACDLLRRTILARCPMQPPPEWISGHAADGAPTPADHIAISPIADLGTSQSTGRLLGLSVLVPNGVSAADRRMLLEPAISPPFGATHIRLQARRNAQFHWDVGPAIEGPSVADLQRQIGLLAVSRIWASATPVTLERHSNDPIEVARALATSCRRVGLPWPRRVAVTTHSPIPGTQPAHRMQLMRAGPRNQPRRHIHVVLDFHQHVRGPIVIGAGRFRGYGLMLSWPSDRLHEDIAWLDMDASVLDDTTPPHTAALLSRPSDDDLEP